MREQYAHIIDMVPTVLDVLGIEPPKMIRGVPQSPLHGTSFAHTFDDPAADSRRTTQYFEMLGHRSIYHDGWRAVCPWPGPSFAEAGRPFGEPISAEKLAELDAEGWELYHVAEDPAENHDLAAEHRDRLIALIATWYVEAGKYDVMPIDGSGVARMAGEKPLIAAPRDRFIYYPDTQSVPFFAGARVLNRPHSITADVEIPEEGAEGVLLCQGTSAGGFTLYVKDRRLHYTHNWVGRELLHLASDAELTAGQTRAALRVRADRPARPRARATERPAASSSTSTAARRRHGRRIHDAVRVQPRGLTCGADPGSTVTDDYKAPFRFTGTLHTVTVDLSGELIHDPEAELKMHMARQ